MTSVMFSRRQLLWSSTGLWAAGMARAAESGLSDAAMEEFLLKGSVTKTRNTKMGITGSLRVTMKHGEREHDAHIQTIDESKAQFQGATGSELNFRDTWKFNVAGYKLDRMLALNRTPVSVPRRHEGKEGAWTWWIDDVMMVEAERAKKKTPPPDKEAWNRQMQIVHVFDQLIYNMDRNLQNLVITNDWKVWMIDHTRAFRMHKQCKDPKVLRFCEKGFHDKLKTLNENDLSAQMNGVLTKAEIQGLLGRRDHILKVFDQQIAQRGETTVLYTL